MISFPQNFGNNEVSEEKTDELIHYRREKLERHKISVRNPDANVYPEA